MWAVVDAGLATRTELEHLITLDEYMSATEYLQAKIKAAETSQQHKAR